MFGDSYRLNKVCDLEQGTFFSSADYAWKMWRGAPPLRECKKSEKDSYYYFFSSTRAINKKPGTSKNFTLKTVKL